LKMSIKKEVTSKCKLCMHFMTMLETVSPKLIIHPVTTTTSMTVEMPQLRRKTVQVQW